MAVGQGVDVVVGDVPFGVDAGQRLLGVALRLRAVGPRLQQRLEGRVEAAAAVAAEAAAQAAKVLRVSLLVGVRHIEVVVAAAGQVAGAHGAAEGVGAAAGAAGAGLGRQASQRLSIASPLGPDFSG